MAEQRDTLVRLADVFENVAKCGAVYFVGYLGGAKLVMLKRKDAKDGEPGWTLFVTERPAKPSAGNTGTCRG